MQGIQQLLESGRSHHQAGRLEDAWDIYAEVLRRSPKEPDALHLSGVIADLRGDHADAQRRIGEAIESDPRNPIFRVNYGNALIALGRQADAEAAFRQAIALDPRIASAHYNLGNLLLAADKSDEAIAEYDQAVVHDPRHFNALLALCRLMATRKQWTACMALSRRAIELQPGNEEVLRFNATACYKCGRIPEALRSADMALAVIPGDPGLLTFKADVLGKMNRHGESIAVFRQALAINPSDAQAFNGLSDVLSRIGRPAEALEVLRQAIAHCPTRADLFSDYLFMSNYREDASAELLAEEHRRWDRLFGQVPRRALRNVPNPSRRLRVGYVSADFCSHSVSYFIEPVLERHDRKDFVVHCFSSTQHPDPVTERIRAKVDSWHDVVGVSDEEVADLVSRHNIDILVDLAGHTARNRMSVFARKPAPVQISYLGYPNTTGVTAIDYRISDREADPPEFCATWNSETVLHLPDCFHCYRPSEGLPIDAAPPYRGRGYVTFGSFNVLSKISDATLSSWARILNAVPTSRLFVKTRGLVEAAQRDALVARMRTYGVPTDRIDLAGSDADHAAHMRRYREVDIALDTFPYNGTTTTCDALWMGVPVVTFEGNRHSARVGASLLKAAALGELVAANADDYVAIAVALANEPSRLDALHAGLRARLQASPLMDEARFTRNLEALYREAWRRWCEQPPSR